MTINKYEGRTKEEAIEKAKQELGESAVVLNVKEIKPKGLFKIFKSSVYEVTAAMEEKEAYAQPKRTEGIDLTADEQVSIPQPQSFHVNEELERRLENLSHILEQQLSAEKKQKEEREKAEKEEEKKEIKEEEKEEKIEPQKGKAEDLRFAKILYHTLIDNEVDEKYVNQIMDEGEKVFHNGNNVDAVLSNVYQKLILKFGQPDTIKLDGKKPRIIFFIGPTGVGKTTTLAKIASKYKIEYEKKVAFLTTDTYRIAATEQLQIYANILEVPMNIVYSADEFNTAVEKVKNYDLVLVDTAGFSHRNETQCRDMKKLMEGVDAVYEKEVYLVLSVTTKYRDLLEMVDIYKEVTDYKLIFTKLDETSFYGNILNVRLHSGANLAYMTAGQNVPDDIEVFDTQKIVKHLLGGR